MMHYNLKTEKQLPHWYCFPEYSRKQMKLVKILCRHSVDKKIEDFFRKIECYRYIVYAIVEDNHFSVNFYYLNYSTLPSILSSCGNVNI